MERKTVDFDTEIPGLFQQRQYFLRESSELFGQIHLGLRIREAYSDKHLNLILELCELFQFADIIGNKHPAAVIKSVGNVRRLLDGVGMDALGRVDSVLSHDINLTVGGEIKAGAFFFKDINHSVLRERLKSIMESHTGQSVSE
jgi:hypothetical protein